MAQKRRALIIDRHTFPAGQTLRPVRDRGYITRLPYGLDLDEPAKGSGAGIVQNRACRPLHFTERPRANYKHLILRQ